MLIQLAKHTGDFILKEKDRVIILTKRKSGNIDFQSDNILENFGPKGQRAYKKAVKESRKQNYEWSFARVITKPTINADGETIVTVKTNDKIRKRLKAKPAIIRMVDKKETKKMGISCKTMVIPIPYEMGIDISYQVVEEGRTFKSKKKDVKKNWKKEAFQDTSKMKDKPFKEKAYNEKESLAYMGEFVKFSSNIMGNIIGFGKDGDSRPGVWLFDQTPIDGMTEEGGDVFHHSQIFSKSMSALSEKLEEMVARSKSSIKRLTYSELVKARNNLSKSELPTAKDRKKKNTTLKVKDGKVSISI